MREIKIDDEFKALIPPLTENEYFQLEENILRDGIREPLSVWGNTLVDGHNRYRIAQKHGIEYETVNLQFETRNDVVLWMIKTQFGRRNISLYDRAVLALKFKPLIRAKAKENQILGAEITNTGSQSSVKAVDTQKELAQIAGVSHDTISKVEKIENKATPELKEKIKTEKLSINQAYQHIQKDERNEKISEQIKTEQTTESIDIFTTDKKYRVVYADPPWSYNDKQDTDKLGGAIKFYPTMTIKELCELPIKNISEEISVLFIWVTSPILEECFEVVKAWGFKYKASFIWDKVKHNMGHYNSVRHELLLLCTRGSCTPDNSTLHDSVISVERGGHSEKPVYFYEIIESLYLYGNKLELFARNPRLGWSSWGNMI